MYDDWLEEILIAALKEDSWISGDKFGHAHGVTRAAISKRIAELRQKGFDIESSPRRGYRLRRLPDLLMPSLVRPLLSGRFGRVFQYKERTGSTNDDAISWARSGAPEGAVVVAEEQTHGKGRFSRSWHSPPRENIYVSVVLRPKAPPHLLPLLTLVAGVALYDTLRHRGFNPEIKWPNDILLSKKKVAGVLTEMHAEAEHILFVILGIGMNVNTVSFPDELAPRATSLRLSLGDGSPPFLRAPILAELLGQLERRYDEFERDGPSAPVHAFRERFSGYGKTCRIVSGSQTYGGVVHDIGEDGSLLLIREGNIHRIVSGEVVLWE